MKCSEGALKTLKDANLARASQDLVPRWPLDERQIAVLLISNN